MKILFFALLFVSSNVLAAGRIQLALQKENFRQGAIVSGILRIDPAFVNIPVPKLKGSSFAETIYFHEISPLLKKEKSQTYESEVEIIFIRVPETNAVSGKIGNEEVIIEWNPVTIEGVEASGQMLWADFTAPDILVRNWMWLWIIPALALLGFGGFRIWKQVARKSRIRAKRKKLIEEIHGCSTYEDVVGLWKKKHSYLREFPQLEEPFRKLEGVLFRYQFKPVQTGEEKTIVVSAYREFVQESEGGLRGI